LELFVGRVSQRLLHKPQYRFGALGFVGLCGGPPINFI